MSRCNPERGLEPTFTFSDDTLPSIVSLRSGRRAGSPSSRHRFGYTCMALDPDGHRLRLYCPAPELG